MKLLKLRISRFFFTYLKCEYKIVMSLFTITSSWKWIKPFIQILKTWLLTFYWGILYRCIKWKLIFFMFGIWRFYNYTKLKWQKIKYLRTCPCCSRISNWTSSVYTCISNFKKMNFSTMITPPKNKNEKKCCTE